MGCLGDWGDSSGSDTRGDLRGRLFFSPNAVGAGLLAMTVCQPTNLSQMHTLPVGLLAKNVQTT
jgi:hypothetical protein